MKMYEVNAYSLTIAQASKEPLIDELAPAGLTWADFAILQALDLMGDFYWPPGDTRAYWNYRDNLNL